MSTDHLEWWYALNHLDGGYSAQCLKCFEYIEEAYEDEGFLPAVRKHWALYHRESWAFMCLMNSAKVKFYHWTMNNDKHGWTIVRYVRSDDRTFNEERDMLVTDNLQELERLRLDPREDIPTKELNDSHHEGDW